jgi:hypothetical protein
MLHAHAVGADAALHESTKTLHDLILRYFQDEAEFVALCERVYMGVHGAAHEPGLPHVHSTPAAAQRSDLPSCGCAGIHTGPSLGPGPRTTTHRTSVGMQSSSITQRQHAAASVMQRAWRAHKKKMTVRDQLARVRTCLHEIQAEVTLLSELDSQVPHSMIAGLRERCMQCMFELDSFHCSSAMTRTLHNAKRELIHSAHAILDDIDCCTVASSDQHEVPLPPEPPYNPPCAPPVDDGGPAIEPVGAAIDDAVLQFNQQMGINRHTSLSHVLCLCKSCQLNVEQLKEAIDNGCVSSQHVATITQRRNYIRKDTCAASPKHTNKMAGLKGFLRPKDVADLYKAQCWLAHREQHAHNRPTTHAAGGTHAVGSGGQQDVVVLLQGERAPTMTGAIVGTTTAAAVAPAHAHAHATVAAAIAAADVGPADANANAGADLDDAHVADDQEEGGAAEPKFPVYKFGMLIGGWAFDDARFTDPKYISDRLPGEDGSRLIRVVDPSAYDEDDIEEPDGPPDADELAMKQWLSQLMCNKAAYHKSQASVTAELQQWKSSPWVPQRIRYGCIGPPYILYTYAIYISILMEVMHGWATSAT